MSNLTDPVKHIELITLCVISLPNLEELTMFMRPTAGRVIFENLHRLTKLSSLTLNNDVRELDQQMGPQHALLIMKSMKDCTTLQSLDLSMNNFGDEGAQFMSEMLRQNSSLTYLSLRRNHITDADINQIVDALQENKTLTSLDLRGNNINDPSTLEHKLKQLPNLKYNITQEISTKKEDCSMQ